MRTLFAVIIILSVATIAQAGNRQKTHRTVSQNRQVIRQQVDFHTMVRRNAISRRNQLTGYYTLREVFTDRPRCTQRNSRRRSW